MQNMRDMLRGQLGRSLRPLPALDRLAAAWPVACGSALAGHAEVTGYEQGIVHIRVAGSQWLDIFGHMRAVLASDLSRIAGVPVSAIHFEQAPSRDKL